MYTTPMLQSLQGEFRKVISDIHTDINVFRAAKRKADESGDLETEYGYHSLLKAARKDLARFVRLQKATKQMLKGS